MKRNLSHMEHVAVVLGLVSVAFVALQVAACSERNGPTTSMETSTSMVQTEATRRDDREATSSASGGAMDAPATAAATGATTGASTTTGTGASTGTGTSTGTTSPR